MYIVGLYAITATLITVFGVLSLFQNFRSSVNRAFFCFCFFTLAWICTLYFGFDYAYANEIETANVLFRLVFGFGAAFMFFLTVFFYRFPKVSYVFPRVLQWAFLGLTAGLILSSVFTTWVYDTVFFAEDGSLADEFGPLYPAFLGYTFLNYGIQIYLFFRKIFLEQGIERRKTVLAFVGMFVFNFAVIMTNVILPLFNIYVFQVEAVSFSLLFILPAFYSMQKYRFFDFSYVSLKLVRHLILLSVFVFSMGLFYTGISAWVPVENDQFAYGASALVALILYLWAERIFPELVNKGFRDFRDRLRTFQSSIYYCNSYSALVDALEKTFVVQLLFSDVKLMLVRDKTADTDMLLYQKNPFTKYIEKQRPEVLILDEIELQAKPEDTVVSRGLRDMDAAYCIPLYLETRLIGLLFLGNRPDGQLLNQQELREILEAKQLVEISFINILLQSNLREENDLMKELIRKKTQTLRDQNEKVRGLLRQQSDFLAVTAHEFRTPLSIALFQLEDTLDSFEHSEQVLDDMKVLESSLNRLKGLTQSLFDAQQYDMEKVELEKELVEVQEFVKGVYQEFGDIMDQKTIRFDLDIQFQEPLRLFLDPLRMRQVLHNLLTNASKFTPEQGEVSLRVSRQGDELRVEVVDSGKGIADDAKRRIFEKFQTTHVSAGSGIGMGLYLCKKIVELHAGTIHAQDTPGGGATVVFMLPIDLSKGAVVADSLMEATA